MRSRAFLLVALLLLAGCRSHGDTAPEWVKRQGREAERFYVNTPPKSESYASEGGKWRARYELGRTVICGGCSSPSNTFLPRGDVVAIWFDAETHKLTDMSLGP